MIARFADTSFYVALSNPRDSLHGKACQLANDYHGSVITTDFVVVEVGNFLSSAGDRRSLDRLIKVFRNDPRTLTVPATRDWLNRGVALYLSRPDKKWSLTDCISFVVMHEHGVTEALTGDHHFAQAGFTPLFA